MNSDFIPYGRQEVTPNDIDSVVRILQSPWLTQGPTVPLFEQSLSARTSDSHVVAVNSATSALHIACLALGLKSGDIVWTSPISFVASANCALYCGASVDFVDIDISTGLISAEALKRKLLWADTNNCLPKILIPVHLAGSSCDMEAIYNLCRPYDIFILEDASHAVGASYNGSPVGSCEFSHAAVFSFHPVKIITSGEGGAIATRDSSLYRKLCLLRSHGITKDPTEFLEPTNDPWYYEQQYLGLNYRLTDIQAALGLSQLERLDDIVSTRNHLYNNYLQLLDDSSVSLLPIPPSCRSSVHLAIVRLPTSTISRYRTIFNFMRSKNIGVQLHYLPIHLQPYYRQLGFTRGDFPCSELYSVSHFSLPLYPGLDFSQQEYIVSTLFDSIAL